MDVWAFGSRAKHTAKPYSDIDLALITQQPLSLEQWEAIIDAFATSDLSIRVYVVDWASTSEAFRKHVAQDRVVVQAAG
jgi:predicted nucleotidyltransferase